MHRSGGASRRVSALHRLALAALPDRLFHGLRWIILILVLFILSHAARQTVIQARMIGNKWTGSLRAAADRKDIGHDGQQGF